MLDAYAHLIWSDFISTQNLKRTLQVALHKTERRDVLEEIFKVLDRTYILIILHKQFLQT